MFCGEQQGQREQSLQPENGQTPATGSAQTPEAQQPLVAARARPKGGLTWKIISLLMSVAIIIGGLSRQFVLRGTTSSAPLVVFGLLGLAYDIYALAAHNKKSKATTTGGDAIPAQANRLVIPKDSVLPIISAVLMAVTTLASLILNLLDLYVSVWLVLNALGGILFVIFALALFKKSIRLLFLPIAIDIFISVVRVIGYRPSAYFYISLLVDVALLIVILVTVSGQCKSNKPLVFTVIGVFVAALLNYIVLMSAYYTPVSLVSLLFMLLFYGAYLTIALALKPAEIKDAA
jgi:hypothetical protein